MEAWPALRLSLHAYPLPRDGACVGWYTNNVVSGIRTIPGLRVRPDSVAQAGPGIEFAVVEDAPGDERLGVLRPSATSLPADFEGETTDLGQQVLLVGPRSPGNVEALRRCLAWLRPQVLGLRTSAGFGDRLGLATPGHIRAIRAVGGGIAPVFAQQSIREMSRTQRSPRQVVDDATWGIFSAGWREPFGADADHLKTRADVEHCLDYGYTFWTIDPGDEVDVDAETAGLDALRRKVTELPWSALEDTQDAFFRRYVGTAFDIEHAGPLRMDEQSALRAAAKYGRAVALTSELYRLLRDRLGPHGWEFEVAVDETQPVTTPLEHVYLATELRRLGVEWVSFAPRYLGEFEKGIDYAGDLAAFEQYLAAHAAIARQLGPYKLSLHSGSDKFSIYELAARQTRGLVHLKTAGTSYVEALRTLASLDPALFRSVYAFAREAFPVARVGYHISARLERAPEPADVRDADLPGLLDEADARQVLHVTFGQVLTNHPLAGQLLAALRAAPDSYAAMLEHHFVRHLEPLTRVTATSRVS
jgi:tagaturonate epimerase